MTHFDTTREYALQQDLKTHSGLTRASFYLPYEQEDSIYLASHSLGLAPKSASTFVERELTAWAQLGVLGHFKTPDPWLNYHELVTDGLTKLVGGSEHEVVAMNSLTVNLHLLLVSFYHPTKNRFKILVEANAFPSDIYALKSQIRFHGYDPDKALVEFPTGDDGFLIDHINLIKFIEERGDEFALIFFSGVNYLSGQVFEMEEITKAGQKKGCVVGFDLAHAIGNVPLQCHRWGVDFAVWCSYKYLSGGPGSIGGVFIHSKHAHETLPRFEGWWGQNKATRFEMKPDFDPIDGAEGWQLSNPPILQLAALRSSLEIFNKQGIEKINRLNKDLCFYLRYLIEAKYKDKICIITPATTLQHGAQLSLKISHARTITEKLALEGIYCDSRGDEVLRVSLVSFYIRYIDVYRFVEQLGRLL